MVYPEIEVNNNCYHTSVDELKPCGLGKDRNVFIIIRDVLLVDCKSCKNPLDVDIDGRDYEA